MNTQIVNQLLKLLTEISELAQKLYRALQEGGPPPFSLLPEKAAIDRTTVHRKPADLFGLWDDEAIRREYLRMQTRNRVRRWRERERKRMTAVTETGVTCNETVTPGNASETATYETVQRPMGSLFPAYDETTGVNECNATVTECNAETVTGNAAAKKEKENEKRKNQRKEIKKNKKTKDDTSIGPAKETGERNAAETTATPEAEPDNGNNPPAAEQPPTKSNKIIPTSKLPEAYRNVIEAWNQLPLKTKLKGLYPLVIKQLGYLFEHYGEETVHKAIDRVRESQFLLGQSKNSTGWVVSLTWLLEPEHLEKVLAGQYTDRSGVSNARLFQPGDEATPFGDGFYGTVVY